MKTLIAFIALSILAFSNVFAQAGHSLQLDDGFGDYSILVGSNSGGIFSLPLNSGTLLTSNATGNLFNGIDNPIAQDNRGIASAGLNWEVGSDGYAGIFSNTNNVANSDGLQIAIATTTGISNALTITDGTNFNPTGGGSVRAQVFNVLDNGDISQIKGVNYSWPSSQAAAANYVLTNDGTGSLSWAAGGGTGQPKFVINSQNGNYAITNTDQLVQGDISAGANFNYTLPQANTFAAGQTIILKAVAPTGAPGQINIVLSGTDNIDDGAANVFFGNPIGAGQAIRLYSDGNANWYSW